MEEPIGERTSGTVHALEALLTNFLFVNWDEAMRLLNEQYDKIVAAARLEKAAERERALHNLEQELFVFKADVSDPARLAASFFEGRSPRKTMGRNMGKVLAALMLPAFDAGIRAATRARTRAEIGQLGFALAAYRALHNEYPERLHLLVPQYVAELPADPFTDRALHYARDEDGRGFLLYSVGPNGIDEGGLTQDSALPADDIPLQIPADPERK